MSRPFLHNVRVTIYIKPETLAHLKAIAGKRPVGQAVDELAGRRIIKGRAVVSRRLLAVAESIPHAVASSLSEAGFPLTLTADECERWRNEKWRYQRLRECAGRIGAEWWGFEEDTGGDMVFLWGVYSKQPEGKAP